jgi:hypothetical protein
MTAKRVKVVEASNGRETAFDPKRTFAPGQVPTLGKNDQWAGPLLDVFARASVLALEYCRDHWV